MNIYKKGVITECEDMTQKLKNEEEEISYSRKLVEAFKLSTYRNEIGDHEFELNEIIVSLYDDGDIKIENDDNYMYISPALIPDLIERLSHFMNDQYYINAMERYNRIKE